MASVMQQLQLVVLFIRGENIVLKNLSPGL